MKLAMMAGTASFAHLLGRGGAVAAAKRAEDEDDDDKKKAASAEDRREDDDEETKGKKAKRAESEDREEEDEDREEDEEEERDDAKKGKRAKKAAADDGEEDDDEEGDDGSDGADMRKKGIAPARLRERARCAAIFADAAAGNNPALAAQLAFGTDLPRSQAINVLRAGAAAPAPRRKSLDDRMAGVKTPPIGAGDAAASATPNLADQIVAAGRKVRGEA